MSNKVAATFHGGNTDPRAVLARHRLYGFTGSEVKCMCGWGWESVLDYSAHQAEMLIEADRAAGIVRVRMDDETVERVARALMNSQSERYGLRPRKGEAIFSEAATADARAVLAALRGES
jgi:hypothetical protein